MKRLLISAVLFCGVAWCQICPVEPPDLPPVGMVNARHVCTCEGSSFNCRWAWIAGTTIAAPAPQITPLDASVMNALIHAVQPAPAQAIPPNASRKCLAAAALVGSSVEACMAGERARARAEQAKLEESRQRTMTSLQLAWMHHPDFQAVYQQHPDLLNPSPAMERAIVESKDPGEVVYYLETHAEDYLRIAAMKERDVKRAVMEIDEDIARGTTPVDAKHK